MRAIKFRGRCIDNGEWVYGDLYHEGDSDAFIFTSLTVLGDFMQVFGEAVDPDTVGQYTGLRDKNGKEVYEGDILRDILNPHVDENPYIVFYNTPGGGWFWKCTIDGNEDLLYQAITGNGEVIGNIYENPELLAGTTP